MAEHIEHILHDNGIHEILFLDANRQAVDAYMSQMELLVTERLESDSPEQLNILINLTQTHDLPPFSYLTKKVRHMLHEHLQDRGRLHLRNAILARHDAMMVMSLFESFMKLLPIDMEMKIFEANQRENAIHWILADE